MYSWHYFFSCWSRFTLSSPFMHLHCGSSFERIVNFLVRVYYFYCRRVINCNVILYFWMKKISSFISYWYYLLMMNIFMIKLNYKISKNAIYLCLIHVKCPWSAHISKIVCSSMFFLYCLYSSRWWLVSKGVSIGSLFPDLLIGPLPAQNPPTSSWVKEGFQDLGLGRANLRVNQNTSEPRKLQL